MLKLSHRETRLKQREKEMRLTLDEYSRHFKMSKEMIHSRLKEKRINYIIEDGVTYIIVTKNSIDTHKKELQMNENILQEVVKDVARPKITVATVLALYQRENQQLKEKITQLESKIDKLVDDKERMLRDEMNKIEQVYNAKDEQLKNILELVNAKLMLENKKETIHEIESYETSNNTVAIEESDETSENSRLVELRDYLKTLGLKSSQRKIIKKRFLSVYDNDVRVLQQNGKLYLDFSKYDYSDLLEC